MATKPVTKKTVAAQTKPASEATVLQRRLTVRFETDEQKMALTADAAHNRRSINAEVLARLFPHKPAAKK